MDLLFSTLFSGDGFNLVPQHAKSISRTFFLIRGAKVISADKQILSLFLQA